MIDPVISRLIAVGFGLMWIAAAWHKQAAPQVFRAVLADYRLLPAYSQNVVGRLLPMVEAMLGLAWLLGIAVRVTAVASAALLACYAVAIAVNLLRGRNHIGCGCSFSVSADDEPLSWTMVVRNVFLLLVSLAALLPANPRLLGPLDYIVVVSALFVLLLLRIAASQLLRNGAAIRSWRHSYD
jgi:hypothetical protein